MCKLFLILFFSLFLQSCKNTNEQIYSDSNISNLKAKDIVFIFNKDSSNISTSYLVPTKIKYSKYNDFHEYFIEVDRYKEIDTVVLNNINTKICIKHFFNKLDASYYVFMPGDTIIFNYTKGIPHVTLKGRNTKKSDLSFWIKEKTSEPNDINSQKKYETHKIYTENNLKKLDSLFKTKSLSEDQYLLNRNQLYYYHINVNKDMFDFENIDISDLKKDEYLCLGSYKYFVENYVLYKAKLEVDKNDSFKFDFQKAFDYTYASNEFSYSVKEFFLFRMLVSMKGNLPKKVLDSYYEKFKLFCKNQSVLKELDDIYFIGDFINHVENKTLVITKFRDKIELIDIVQKNKDSIIYIDFWASWCAPCRASFPASKKLHKKYKDKPVKFIYVSVDKDFDAWQKASIKEALDYKNSFLAINYPETNFYEENQLKSIPRYMIFYKGKLVNNNAPNPSNFEIEKELDKYLLKN
jgi:thiol-disulfide isomerase/thioredoxin